MAVTKTINGTVSQNANLYTYQLYCEEKDVNNSANTSKLKVTVRIVTGGSSGTTYASRYQSATHTITINGTNYTFTSGNYSLVGQTTTTLGSVTSNAITHSDDGTKTVNVSASSPDLAQGGGYGPYSGSASGSVTLTSIPRYATINSFTVSQRDETSLAFSFTASATCDYAWYSTNNGSTWTGVDIADGTSGSFNVTGLSANTSYTCKLRVRRKDSQLNTDSSAVTQSTYDYPKVSSIGSNPLTIGNQQTLTLYNPLGRNVTVKMYQNNTSGTQLFSGTTSNKTTYSFTPTASTLYNSIPNNSSANCVYTVTYSGVTKTSSTASYKIRGDEYPTFSDSNWSYGANLTSLTNSNQVIIDKYATITTTINTVATSSYGANIDKYVVEWGNATPTQILSGTTSGTITNGSGNTLKVTVYDKRGLPKETIKTITNVPYTDITINNDINTQRTNGVEAGTKLNLRGTFYNAKFGSSGVQNAIYSAKYYVSTNGTTWAGPYPNGDAFKNAIIVSGNNFSVSNFDIHANGSSGGFTIGTQYYVKVEIKDAQGLLSTGTATTTVTDGKIARDIYKDSSGDYHEGINGLADSNYTQKVYGKIKADEFVGDLNGNASTATTAGSANTATTASKLGSSNVGNSNRPIYLNGGTATQCNTPESGNWFRGVPFISSGGVMEIGRYIDFHPTNASTLDYSKRIDAGTGTTARTITIPDESGTMQMKPTNLYNNATGTTGTVTLSETSANFNFLKIYYYKDESGAGGKVYHEATIYSPNSKLATLFSVHYANATNHQMVSKVVQISGTSITHKYGMLTNVTTSKTIGACEIQNAIYIVRVDGYK